MVIKKNRKEERFYYKVPEFVFAELRLGKETKKEKVYDLKVLDCSKYGIGLVITKKDFDLLNILKEGDKLHNIFFFASWTMIKVDGIVRHLTKIEEGKYKGCHLLDIESPDIIDSCKPMKVKETGT